MVTDPSPRSAIGGNHSQTVAEKDNEGGRVDVEGAVAHTEVGISRIHHAQRGYKFKEQLKEIDVAIYGDTTDTMNHHHTVHDTSMTDALRNNL